MKKPRRTPPPPRKRKDPPQPKLTAKELNLMVRGFLFGMTFGTIARQVIERHPSLKNFCDPKALKLLKVPPALPTAKPTKRGKKK